MMKPITVAFFGISGSGKGTQCELLEKFLREHDEKRDILRPEMGNLLRTFMQTGTTFAKNVEEIITGGGLVPSFMPIYLLTKVVNESFDGTQHVILDGTCRRPDQSRAANDIMRMFGRDDLRAIVLTLSKEAARERLKARGRFDDVTEEALDKRFAWYQDQVVPSIEALRELGWNILEIDGEPDVETIHKDILAALDLA
jgi:adenylate kinase